MFQEISQKLTLHAKAAIKEAKDIAFHYGSESIEPAHLLFAVYLEKGSLGSNILENMGVKRDAFNKILGRQNEEAAKLKNTPKLSLELKSIITRAYSLANAFSYPYVGTEHLVYALVESENATIRKIIGRPKIQKGSTDFVLQANIGNDSFPNLSKIFDLPEINLSKIKSRERSATPHLDQFCTNLNIDAEKRGEIIIGREKEIERIINILGRKNKNNPVLIGEPGVGKTAIVAGLAQKINAGEVPPDFLNKKIMALDMALVVAGTSFRGEFETRLKEVIREATENKNVILFIDEIHNIVGAGNVSGSLDAANILKPALSRGEIQCVGATTAKEYKKYIEKDPALERRLQPVKVSEPGLEDTKKILEGVKENFEKFHSITISPDAIVQAVELSVRYISDRFLPDKALDVIDETASYVRNKNKVSDNTTEIKKLELELEKTLLEKNALVTEEKYEEAAKFREKESELKNKIETLRRKQREKDAQNPIAITSFDIREIISQMAGVPIEKLSLGKIEKIKNLERNLNSQIIGQKEALGKLANVLLRAQSGIANPDRPLGSFLFLGPTGVGKTLTAKILANEIFERRNALVRIDMSEFMERHSISQLIGAPAGYVGFGEGGKLTEEIRRNPYSVVLFDEIEKAHPDAGSILLQILEDGTLTDAEGRQVNFKNTIIILTSNLGTAEFTTTAKVGFESKDKDSAILNKFNAIKNTVLEELKRQMKPELVNRLDHIIVFNTLGGRQIKKIAALELENLKKRLEKQGFALKYCEKIAEVLAQKSIAFEQGARLVRKNIENLVENQIAKMIVEGKVRDGKIGLEVKQGKIILS